MIIDFHTHTFPDTISEKALHKLSMASATLPFTDGTLGGLLSSMEKAGVDKSVTLPVMTSPGQVEKINAGVIATKDEMINKGIIPFGGMHPEYENYKEQFKLLRNAGIPGIKLHPAYQNMDLTDLKMLKILDAANEENLIILIHAGIDIGIYDHNYSSVAQILQVIKEIHPTKFVLAHMGGWGCWDDVERDLAGAPVYLDTAFSIGAITPAPEAGKPPIRTENLSDDQFLRIVRKHGSDKILFATDSPWEDPSVYLDRLYHMSLTDQEMAQILGENAMRLLG